MNVKRHCIPALLLSTALLLGATTAHGADADAAQSVAKQSNCFRCHGIDKDKDGPSWRKLAAKFKGDAKAAEKLEHQMTGSVKVKFADGHEEDHPNLKTTDKGEIKNLIEWMLAL